MFLFSFNTHALEHINWDFQEDGPFCPLLGYKFCTMEVYTGDIVKGDADRLDGYIGKLAKLDNPTRIGMIQLSSNGGDVEEALRLGRILRKNKIQVIIPMDSHCYSSCVLLLAGGVARFPWGMLEYILFIALALKNQMLIMNKRRKSILQQRYPYEIISMK
jgi:hypothetical protein